MKEKNFVYGFEKYCMKTILLRVIIIALTCFTGLSCSKSGSGTSSPVSGDNNTGTDPSVNDPADNFRCEKKIYPENTEAKSSSFPASLPDMKIYNTAGESQWLNDRVVFKLKDYSAETSLKKDINSPDINSAWKKDKKTRIARIKGKHKKYLNIRGMTGIFPERKSRKRTRKFRGAAQENRISRAEKRLDRIYRANIQPGKKLMDVLQSLHKDPDIEWAEPAYIYKISETIPNDTDYEEKQKDYLQQMNLPRAWDIETGSSDVVVAVIDTGVNYDHEDLKNNIWKNPGEVEDGKDSDGNGYVDDIRGWDFVNVGEGEVYTGEDYGPADNDPMDFQGHGTHVAGIIGAEGNNGEGVTGVSWKVSIMPLRAGYKDKNGHGPVAYGPEALEYACSNGADIVNMSFGAPYASLTIKEAIELCDAKGVLLVAAAGNSFTDTINFPAGYEDVIAVAATEGFKGTAGLKKWSPSNFGIWVDIAAPGSFIYSTGADSAVSDEYFTAHGTSMATPMVCGIAALLKSSKPELTAYELFRHLYAYARNLSEYDPDYHLDVGAGLVQAVPGKKTSELPGMVKVVSLHYENETRPGNLSFQNGDEIIIRPTLRNFSCVDKDVSVKLILSENSSLVPVDDAICLRNVDRDRKVTSWQDTLKVKVNLTGGTEEAKEETFTLEVSDETGVISREECSLTINYFLSKKSMVSDPDLYKNDNNNPVMTLLPDGRISMVYRSFDPGNSSQLYLRLRDVNGAWGPVKSFPNESGKFQRSHSVIADVADADGKLCIAWVEHNSDESSGVVMYTTYDPDSESWGDLTDIADIADNVKSSVTSIMLDNDNNPHISWSYWEDLDTDNSGYICTKKFDGTGWSDEGEIITISESYNYLYHKISSFTDSEGKSLLVWLETDGVYYSQFDEFSSVWSGRNEIYSNNYNGHDFSAAIGPDKNIHLAYIDNLDSDYYLYYTVFNGISWSESSHVGGWLSYVNTNRMKIAVNNSGNPEIYAAFHGNGLYRSSFDGKDWQAPSIINPVKGADFENGDLVITGTGEVVAGLKYTISWIGSYIYTYSTQYRENLLPDRPAVEPLTVNESNQFVIKYSSESNSNGEILGYFLAVGTAPGKSDLMAWTDGLETKETLNLNLTSLPYMKGQAYYVSVIAVDSNGYISPVGSNHPDVTEGCE